MAGMDRIGAKTVGALSRVEVKDATQDFSTKICKYLKDQANQIVEPGRNGDVAAAPEPFPTESFEPEQLQ